MDTRTENVATPDRQVTKPGDVRDTRTRLQRRRDELAATGFNASEWARSNGFNPSTVHGVLSGDRKGLRGQAHRIAVLLGLKEGEVDLAQKAVA